MKSATRSTVSIPRRVAGGATALTVVAAVGLGSYDALRAATVEAARFLGVDVEIGTVEVGKRADLVLFEANRLDDVGNAREPVGVVLRGHWMPPDGAGVMTTTRSESLPSSYEGGVR